MNVYVCSPYGGKEENYKEAQDFCREVAAAGHTPFASHVMLHGILQEPTGRAAGLQAGLDMLALCSVICVFGDKITAGMEEEIAMAQKLGITVKYVQNGVGNRPPAEQMEERTIQNWAQEYEMAMAQGLALLGTGMAIEDAKGIMEAIRRAAIAISTYSTQNPPPDLLEVFRGLVFSAVGLMQKGVVASCIKANIKRLPWQSGGRLNGEMPI